MTETDHSPRAIYARVLARLKEVGLSAHAASMAAGHADAVRNLQRAAMGEFPGRRGISTDTLIDLARVLQTSAEYLLYGSAGDEVARLFAAAPEPIQTAVLAILRSSADPPDADLKAAQDATVNHRARSAKVSESDTQTFEKSGSLTKANAHPCFRPKP